MRVLMACSLGGSGHLTPVVSAARVAQQLGHQIIVLIPPSLVAAIGREGVPYEVGDEPSRTVIDGIWARVRAGPAEAVLGLIDRELFADRCTQAMLAAARGLRDRWRPDLVIRESCEYSSAISASEAGIPQAQIGVSQASIEWGVLEMVSPIIERACSGVTQGISQAPYLTPFPASLDPSPWPDTRRFRQPTQAAGSLPHWWPGDDRPLVYLTFGSVIGHLGEATGVFRSALDAVAQLPARVLLAVGRATDAARLGEIRPTPTSSTGSLRATCCPTPTWWSVTAARAPFWARWPPACQSSSVHCSQTKPRTGRWSRPHTPDEW
jgi:UDP:flavonoid glycosyltransferase YjiC (YdhE family)